MKESKNINADKFAKDLSKDEALEVLKTSIDQIIEFYLNTSCPCAFPRFLFIVGFDGGKYTKSLLHTFETNIFVNVTKSLAAFLQNDADNKGTYVCKICGTQYNYIYDEFSAAFSLQCFMVKDVKALTKGASVEFPFPLFAGLYIANGAQNEKDVQKELSELQQKFPSVKLAEFINYMCKV
jgi:hypothetical protein